MKVSDFSFYNIIILEQYNVKLIDEKKKVTYILKRIKTIF